ncbi:MAG TPA: alpha,alpha-trehalose-phosphate synthase (UDP-forming) [Rhodocyclaceae bacterium]|nr:alpha,alpha-trehalose-phosphate synthase (UDP-forming) [Rhodocyclaceae bacterium]
MSRLVVISNRVALPSAEGRPAPGGLAVAVEAAMRGREGMWLGWSGKVSEEPGALQTVERGRLRYVLTDVRPNDFQEYYNGFANRVLWPILHYRVDLAEFNQADFEGYRRVNEFFAERFGPLLEPDDVVWVHDYHLMPLARALRARGHGNRIGFFLHIPMPPPDLLTTLPRHEDVVGALAEFDLIGFQTENDAANFTRYLTTVTGAATHDGRRFRVGGRSFRVGVFPVGVDPQALRRLADTAQGGEFARELEASLAGRSLLIGVDRLDYSKGILHRLDAFERFLEKYPDWHGRATYLQIAPPSRADIPEYMDMDATVSAKVGHINGRFGGVAWVPLRYVNRSYQRDEIAVMLRMARVALVTPLRDGMNLVAKEFVAAQNADDPGVLVLSQFAGAAAELEAAVLVNPHDRDALATAIDTALRMPLEERRARHREMLAVIEANHIRFWGQSFLEALTRPGRVLNWLSSHVALR